MSEDRQPRVDDRVRVVVEGIVTDLDDHECVAMVKADGETRAHYVPRGADITVLEPADDPSKDDVGTLRREDHRDQDPPGVSLWQCIHRLAYGTLWLCVHSTAKGNLEAVLDHADVVGMPVIGSVPGTPAAEAQEAEEQARQEAKEWRANKAGYDTSDASFVYNSNLRSDGSSIMSFHRVGGTVHIRIHHHDDDRFSYRVAVVEEEDIRRVAKELGVLAEPPVIDAKTPFPPPAGTAPRVFESDGPEPPQDVTSLRYLDANFTEARTPFLRRTEVGWVWATATSTIIVRHGYDWATAVRPGRYEEVLP